MQVQKQQSENIEQDDASQFTPKALSPRQTIMMTIKVLAILGAVLALLWWLSQSHA